jgi:pimeloyl-ACP methyl ester carboxylesterase
MPRFWGICCAMSLSASIILSGAVAQTVKDVAINGVHLPYVEQGVGEPMVFVHGLISDLRTWDPVKERIAQKYRFVAYTQRYFGTAPWNDEGKAFSISNLADDLAKFIVSLNAGPVHLVAWSYGGQPATLAATQNPSLVRSLILYEPSVMSVLPETSTEGKIARADRAKMVASSVAASKSGDASKSGRLLAEAVFRLAPGDSSHEPDAWQRMWEENGRVNSLAFAAAPSPVTCDTFKSFSKPTLLMRGETTYLAYQLINNEISRCVPGAKQVILANVNHDGPIRDPEGFTAAIFEFLSNQSR